MFLPLIAISGVTGVFFRALAITVGASLLTSLALALTWTPTLSQFFIRGTHAEAPPRTDLTDADLTDKEKLMAAEDASHHRTVSASGRLLRTLAALCAGASQVDCGFRRLVLIAVVGVRLPVLGTDLLPEMDEGGFIVDYLSPAGSSLQETNRMVSHIEQMLREIPEVESTSRRTGLELGLAAVTEANRGDIAVKLKSKRNRSGDEIISELRARVEKEEPGLEVEYVQVLQDMIGDLSNAPEPVQIKLFSPDAALLATVGAEGRRRDSRRQGRRRHAERNREHDQRTGHGLPGRSNGRGARRIHARRSCHRCQRNP